MGFQWNKEESAAESGQIKKQSFLFGYAGLNLTAQKLSVVGA